MTRRLASMAIAAALAFSAATLMTAAAQTPAQKKADLATRKETSRGGATDPNVKDDSAANAKGKASGAPAPQEKSGEKPRGALCEVMFDNYTDLYVKTYVDGRYAGTMRPWGELYTYAIAGPTVLYARADYTDGSFDHWGPTRISCNTTFTWRLND